MFAIKVGYFTSQMNPNSMSVDLFLKFQALTLDGNVVEATPWEI